MKLIKIIQTINIWLNFNIVLLLLFLYYQPQCEPCLEEPCSPCLSIQQYLIIGLSLFLNVCLFVLCYKIKISNVINRNRFSMKLIIIQIISIFFISVWFAYCYITVYYNTVYKDSKIGHQFHAWIQLTNLSFRFNLLLPAPPAGTICRWEIETATLNNICGNPNLSIATRCDSPVVCQVIKK